jgi:hypothetical protein
VTGSDAIEILSSSSKLPRARSARMLARTELPRINEGGLGSLSLDIADTTLPRLGSRESGRPWLND